MGSNLTAHGIPELIKKKGLSVLEPRGLDF